MKIPTLLLVIALTGCASLNDIDDTLSFIPGAAYSAPTLGGYPKPSGCQTTNCLALDKFEAELYQRARSKNITWVNLVDRFYSGRAELYPNSSDGSGVSELRAYQRMLAEQMDTGRISESQWAYLIEKKAGELNARNQAIRNSTPRRINCTTTSTGTRAFPSSETTCN